jgi:hypothetical protein
MELDSHEVTKIVPASQAWVNWGRKLLCEEKDFVRNSNLERLQTWQRRMPAPMTDEFGLARHWPCYMESLRPFPESDNELLDRANDVYRFIAGTQCFDGTYKRFITKQALTVLVEYNAKDNKYNTFSICSCVVQFKLIGPIIRELNTREKLDGHTKKLKELLERFCRECSVSVIVLDCSKNCVANVDQSS